MPRRPLTNVDLSKYGSDIPHFRGVFMTDELPKKPWKNESAIVNLDDSDGPGTHWVCYRKRGKHVLYFDSYGDLPPPEELVRYLKGCEIRYNFDRFQKFDTFVCGHLCLEFLHKNP